MAAFTCHDWKMVNPPCAENKVAGLILCFMLSWGGYNAQVLSSGPLGDQHAGPSAASLYYKVSAFTTLECGAMVHVSGRESGA